MLRTSPKLLCLTVDDESAYSTREERSDAMVETFESLDRRECDLLSIQLFSAGSSISAKMKQAILKKISDGITKYVFLAGIEMSTEEIVGLSKEVHAAGGVLIWFSGGSDQYEVRSQGPPSNTSGNFKDIAAKDDLSNQVEIIPASEALYGDAGVSQIVHVVHNSALRDCADHIKTILYDEYIADRSKALIIIHFVSTQDTTAAAEGRYGDLIFSHANIGSVQVANLLIGGLDSGDRGHAPTKQWFTYNI